MDKECLIISCFSCLGKTYASKLNNQILDLESSWYKWIYEDPILALDVEKRKGISSRSLNPDYPNNYLNAIKKNISKYKIILITPEKRIRELLKEENINYTVAYPNNPEFTIKRALKRGNNNNFAEGLKKSFYDWYPAPDEKVIWINENEYIIDILKDNCAMIV